MYMYIVTGIYLLTLTLPFNAYQSTLDTTAHSGYISSTIYDLLIVTCISFKISLIDQSLGLSIINKSLLKCSSKQKAALNKSRRHNIKTPPCSLFVSCQLLVEVSVYSPLDIVFMNMMYCYTYTLYQTTVITL